MLTTWFSSAALTDTAPRSGGEESPWVSPSPWAPSQHTTHQAAESMLLDPKSPGRNNHCSGACTAASPRQMHMQLTKARQTLNTILLGRLFRGGKTLLPRSWHPSTTLVFLYRGSRHWGCCGLTMHCQPSRVTPPAWSGSQASKSPVLTLSSLTASQLDSHVWRKHPWDGRGDLPGEKPTSQPPPLS